MTVVDLVTPCCNGAIIITCRIKGVLQTTLNGGGGGRVGVLIHKTMLSKGALIRRGCLLEGGS